MEVDVPADHFLTDPVLPGNRVPDVFAGRTTSLESSSSNSLLPQLTGVVVPVSRDDSSAFREFQEGSSVELAQYPVRGNDDSSFTDMRSLTEVEHRERSYSSFAEGVRFRSASTGHTMGSSSQGFPSTYRPVRAARSHTPPRGGRYGQGVATQISGLYLVKFAVSATGCYLGIQLLINFAEVLLPFIFAVICLIVLEPLKKFVMRLLSRMAVILFQRLGLYICLDTTALSDSPRRGDDGMGFASEGEGATNLYGRLPQDSPSDETPPGTGTGVVQPVARPTASVRKLILTVSILFCMLLTGRVLWLTARVFLKAGYGVSENIEFYKNGTIRLKDWFKLYIHQVHIEALDYNKILDGLVEEVENFGKVVTTNVIYTGLQGVVTFIFLIYMLWSPIKVESFTLTREVFSSTSRYLKVKCSISALTGFVTAGLLWAIGLDFAAAFGLLAFLANFLPGVGSVVASVMPCLLAAMDVRKTATQVILALVLQAIVHVFIDAFLEPVFFGISVEIHSVVVILGIWFFYQVWGVPGMLLSVPLLAIIRIGMKSMKNAKSQSTVGEDADTITFLDGIIEGRWMSSVGSSVEEGYDLPMSATMDMSQNVNRKDSTEPGERKKGTNLWSMAIESQVGRDLDHCYQAHRLLLDTLALLVLLGVAYFAPI